MKRKLRLILNGMFYGDRYTKFCLWSVFLLAVLAIGCLLSGAALTLPWLYAVAALLLIIDLFWFRSLHLDVGLSSPQEEEEEEEEQDSVQNEDEEPLPKKDKKKVQKTAKSEDTKEAEKETANPLTEDRAQEVDEKESRKSKAEEPLSEEKLNKLFHVYKVKKNHRPVMIDSCMKYRIHECPAYIWTHRGQVQLLLLEESPRKLSFPEASFKAMRYEKGILANQKKEYLSLSAKSLESVVFSEYKPTYYSVIRNSQQKEAKNLYIMGPDIKFTNTSARELMALFQPEFQVVDETTQSDDYNQYFKQVYRQRILLDDGVIHMKDYQSHVKGILKRLAEAPMTPAAVRMTLADMVQKHLITTDYANYYIQYNRQQKGKR